MGQVQHPAQLAGRVLDPDGAPQRLRPPLAAQDKPHPRRIHKAHPAKIQHQGPGAPADQGVVQRQTQGLGRVVVDLPGQIGVEGVPCRAEAHVCHRFALLCL